MDFTGNMVALVTPFRNGSFDRVAFDDLIEHCIAGGVSAVIPCGTTGESPTLSHDEHDTVVRRAVEVVRGRVPVIAGTGSNATAEGIRLTRAAAEAGADAVLSVSPYYNKPTQEGLVRHFEAIADCSRLPVVLYDIPGRTGVRLALETITRLARHQNVQAIKIASGDVEDVTRIRLATDLSCLCGDDALTLAMLAMGAHGVISVISNLLPERMSLLVESAREGNHTAALRQHEALYPLMKAMFVESNPAPIKAALASIGRIEDELRLPLTPLTPAGRSVLETHLAPFRDALRSSTR